MKSNDRNLSIQWIVCVAIMVAQALIMGLPELVAFCIFAILPLTLYLGIFKTFCNFLGRFVIPLGLILAFLWGVVIKSAPSDVNGNSMTLGFAYSATIAFRLAVLGGVFQLAILSVTISDLPRLLLPLGVSRHTVLGAIGARVLLPEIHKRADQILAARKARGLLRRNGVIQRICELPEIMLPLFVWSLRAGVHRAQMWEETNLIADLVQESSTDSGSLRRTSNSLFSGTLIGSAILLINAILEYS